MLEAARMDGASEAKTFISIVLPMVKPGIGALAIFTFINSLERLLPAAGHAVPAPAIWTLSLGIAKLQGGNAAPTSA